MDLTTNSVIDSSLITNTQATISNLTGVYDTSISGGFLNSNSVFTGTYYQPWTTQYDNIAKNALDSLYSVITFELEHDILIKYISKIENDTMIFNCNFIGNRLQPYETIMSLINKKNIFSIKIKVSDILTISYKNIQFIKIRNNFKYNNNFCDFGSLVVDFKCDDVLYQNEKLSISELRADKLNKILNNEENK